MTRTGASLRTLCLVAVLATPFSSCGGGGGGGALNLAPTLIAVTFVGAGSVPVAGDRLRLVLSEPAAVAGTVLDDADLVLSAGASLGSVSGVPVVVSPHVVELVLGTGVALSPGVSTLDFGSANDAVTDAQGLKAIASAPRTLRKADAQVPVISNLTLSGVDSLLNGTGTAGGTLQVGHNRFSFDVTSSDGSSAIDTTSTLISVSVPVTRNGVTIAAGHNLTGDLTVASSPGLDQFSVPASMTLSSGAVTVTVRVVDASGQVSDPKTFAFQVRFRSSDVELFESGQVWFLDTSRDVEQFSVSLANPTTPVMVVSGANGRSDFEDLLLVLGLLSTTPIANVSGALDSNQVFLDMLRTKVVEQTTALFPGIGITFTFTAPGTFPAQSSSVSYGSFSFSQICLAGSVDTTGTSGVLGLAIFDEHNAYHDNDCLTDFQGSRLGVFLHTLVNNGFLSSGSSQFRTTFDPFTPSRSGTPIGQNAQDGLRLTASLSDSRTTEITTALADLARFIAVIVAHETGHSMGLVKNGAMPNGLYGGDATNFPGSQSGHLVMPASVFPGTSINVMSPLISYGGALDSRSAFNTLNLAYLRAAVIYN